MPDPGKLGVKIERAADVLTFTLDNQDHGNQLNAAMFEAMLSELRREADSPRGAGLTDSSAGKSLLHGPRTRGPGR